MTDLEQVKIIIGDIAEEQDELLAVLLLRAEEIIKRLSRTPKDFDHLKIEAVIVAFNQRGSEGEKSQSSGGFNTTSYYAVMSQFIKENMPAQWAAR